MPTLDELSWFFLRHMTEQEKELFRNHKHSNEDIESLRIRISPLARQKWPLLPLNYAR